MGNLSRIAMWTLSLSALAVSGANAAETGFPSRAMRIVVPFPPGGNVDINARAIAPGHTEALGQQVIAENRPGASGQIGAEAVARETADGGAGSARLGAWMCPGLGLSKSGAGRGTQGCVHNSWPGLLQLLPQTGLRRTSRSRPGSGL